jgi:hypothetical protein
MKSAPTPAAQWIEIIGRPTLEAFAQAFTTDARLEASVLERPLIGPAEIRGFFEATRAMYDQIAFTRETVLEDRTVLEWEGAYDRHPLAGVTIQIRNGAGVITAIQLYHRPLSQVTAFAADLGRRLNAATRRVLG